ncbi:MAG: type I 3-dehydroquinate dehydratase [Lachnospiraceae bacterium]|nr:type I 3-dehydroquinate dehydratase [Lachnospiraceae bacterium]
MREKIKRPMVCVPVTEENGTEVNNQINKIIEKNKIKKIDIVEFRADYYKDLSDADKLTEVLEDIHEKLKAAGIKLLFTIRSKAEGGEALSSDTPHVNVINMFVAGNKLADYIDVEYFSDKKSADMVIKIAKKNDVKVIMSSHDFEKTPSYDEMIKRYDGMHERNADIIKLAVMPGDEADVDSLLNAVSETYEKYPDTDIIGISMGELGRRSRTEGYIFGSCLTFAIIDKASAPGQVSVDEL